MSRSQDPETLSLKEAADLLGVSREFLWEALVDSGVRIPTEAADVRVRAQEIRAWLKRRGAERERDLQGLLRLAATMDEAGPDNR